MISTPMDRYEAGVYDLAPQISEITGLNSVPRKNRVNFEKHPQWLQLLEL